jgi:hypothetical protein
VAAPEWIASTATAERLSQSLDFVVDRPVDENCGADSWAITPAGLQGVVNDAVAIYFPDAALAAAFVSRWCVGSKVEISEGAFRVRGDQPTPRPGARLHKTY